jgi:hypothetical protein
MDESFVPPFPTNQIDWNDLQSIITTALMISGNTIGAGCLVLPEIAAKPGLAISTDLFVGKFCHDDQSPEKMFVNEHFAYLLY